MTDVHYYEFEKENILNHHKMNQLNNNCGLCLQHKESIQKKFQNGFNNKC